MMFSPTGSSPCNHVQSEGVGVVREPRLIHGPVDSEQVFELLTQWVRCRCPKLKANEGPPVLMKDSQVGRSIQVHASCLCWLSSVKERPPTRFSLNQRPEGAHIIEQAKLLDGTLDFLSPEKHGDADIMFR